MKETFLITRGLLMSIPALKLVDKDKGQLENNDGLPPVPPNSALITVNVVRTQKIGDGRKIWFVNIVIRYYADVVKSETSSLVPDEALARSLAYYDTVTDIYETLEGYSDDELEPLDMLSAAEESRRDGLTVMRWVFATSFIREFTRD